MTNLIILPVLLLITASFGFLIYKNFISRDSKSSLFKALYIVVFIIIVLATGFNIYYSNRMPIILKASASYIIDVNEVKEVNSTKVKLKKVFADLNNINATYSVVGGEKVVAVELKKAPQDAKAINQCTGLWIGGVLLPEDSFIGMSYSSDEFISPVYLVFHLSNGESISFEVKDTAGIRNLVRIINIDKTIDYNGSTLTLQKFHKGLNYSSINFKSNFSPTKEIIDIKLLVDDNEMDETSHGWSGGGNGYTGSFGFDPVNAENIKIKITNKSLNKTDFIDLGIN